MMRQSSFYVTERERTSEPSPDRTSTVSRAYLPSEKRYMKSPAATSREVSLVL
jgi:hypothetical protein